MRAAAVLVVVLAFAAPASAQGPADDLPLVSVRPFLEIGQQRFVARQTFEEVFGESSAPFWGGGVQVVLWNGRIYAEAGASRLARENGELTGQRVFVSGDTVYKLGIPLRATIKPWKVAGGYRFVFWRRFVPYVGAGFGSYHYTEESDFAEPGENVDASHSSAVFQAGLETRAHRWVGVAVSLERARVPDILGHGGISQLLASGELSRGGRSETDLGGWSVNLRFVVGR